MYEWDVQFEKNQTNMIVRTNVFGVFVMFVWVTVIAKYPNITFQCEKEYCLI